MFPFNEVVFREPPPFSLKMTFSASFFTCSTVEGTPDKMLGGLGYNLNVPPPAVGLWQSNCSELMLQYSELVGPDIFFS